MDCSQHTGRAFDLCTGQGHDGRPDPRPEASAAFLERHSGKARGSLVAGQELRSPGTNRAVKIKQPQQSGPGTRFRQLLSELNLKLPGCEGCQGTMARMNRAGVDGCKKNRAVFLTEIKSRAKSVTFQKKLVAAWMSLKTGLCWSINPLDPIGSLYDLAVNRAEKQDADPTPG